MMIIIIPFLFIAKYGPPKNKESATGSSKEIKTEKLKTILYWNEAYGSTEYGFCCGQNPYFEFECPVKNCYVTNNRSFLSSVDQFDAILFHQRSLHKG